MPADRLVNSMSAPAQRPNNQKSANDREDHPGDGFNPVSCLPILIENMLHVSPSFIAQTCSIAQLVFKMSMSLSLRYGFKPPIKSKNSDNKIGGYPFFVFALYPQSRHHAR